MLENLCLNLTFEYACLLGYFKLAFNHFKNVEHLCSYKHFEHTF